MKNRIQNSKQATRRDFLKTASGIAVGVLIEPFLGFTKKKPLFSFSTLGCPKWSFETIINCAADNGYNGIEIRGLQGQLDLPKCPEFSSANIACASFCEASAFEYCFSGT